jgi:hypothetical protein
VHQIYDYYDYCFHAFRGYSIMQNLENATPEGATDIQPVNLVAAPFGPHLLLEPNRGRQVSGHTSQDTYLMLAEWLNLSDALVLFKRFPDAYCTWVTGLYKFHLMSRTFRYYI